MLKDHVLYRVPSSPAGRHDSRFGLSALLTIASCTALVQNWQGLCSSQRHTSDQWLQLRLQLSRSHLTTLQTESSRLGR